MIQSTTGAVLMERRVPSSVRDAAGTGTPGAPQAAWIIFPAAAASCSAGRQIPRSDRRNKSARFARRKKLRQRVERNTVIRIVEDRREHCPIRDIKIGVAGGQLAAFEHDRTRHGNFDDLQLLSLSSARVFQPAEVRVEGRVVFTLLIRLDHGDHSVRTGEAGDVIDVAVSVVTAIPLSSQMTDCAPK